MRRHFPNNRFPAEIVEQLDRLNAIFIGGENDRGRFGNESEASPGFRPLDEVVIIKVDFLLPMYDYSFRPEGKGKPNLDEARILEVWTKLQDGQYKVYPDEEDTNFDILIRIGEYAIMLNKTDGTAIDIVEQCGQDALRSIMSEYTEQIFAIIPRTSW